MRAKPYLNRRDDSWVGPKISDGTLLSTGKPQSVDEASRLSPSHLSQSHLSQGPPGFGVAASPLNGVKLDVGVILVLGALLLLVHSLLISGFWLQTGLLLSYGLGAAWWVMYRVRRIMRASQSQRYAQTYGAWARDAQTHD
jgi:hypothetical protein